MGDDHLETGGQPDTSLKLDRGQSRRHRKGTNRFDFAFHELPDLAQRASVLPQVANPHQPLEMFLEVVVTASGPFGRGQQAELDVVADRAAIDAGGLDQLLDAVAVGVLGGHNATVYCHDK